MRASWRTPIWLALVGGSLYAALASILMASDGPVSQEMLLTQEDGVVEYLGALGFLLASVLTFMAMRAARRSGDTGRYGLKTCFLAALALVFFLAAGEEISWGQRIFGVSTPEELGRVNVQNEINLHNLEASGFDEYRLFEMVWLPYVLVLPWLARLWPAARRLIKQLVPLPLWSVGLVFIANDLFAIAVTRVVSEQAGRGIVLDDSRIELREMIFALLCAFTAYTLYRGFHTPRRAVVVAKTEDRQYAHA